MQVSDYQENYLSGYIKSYRSIIKKGWYKKSEYFHLWHHLLYKAGHKKMEGWFKGECKKLNQGQFLTGIELLSSETGIDREKVRRILKVFENDNQIDTQISNKGRLISIVSWDKYQHNDNQNDKQVTNNRQTSDKQVTPNNNVNNNKNVKNDKNIEERKNKFLASIHEINSDYGYSISMINDFFEYWTEPNPSNTKMRFEFEKTWDLERRVARWARKQKEFSKDTKPKTPFDELREQKLKTNEN